MLIPNSIWDGEFPESGTPIHEPILLAEAAVDRHWIAASAEFNDPVAPSLPRFMTRPAYAPGIAFLSGLSSTSRTNAMTTAAPDSISQNCECGMSSHS